MRFAAVLALAGVLTGCSLLVAEPTSSPIVVTHADPFPANPMGTWDAILVVVASEFAGKTEVSVDEALGRQRDGEPLLVRGALFADDAYGQVWLCSRAQRSPDTGGPQCAGAILLIVDESEGIGQSSAAYITALLEVAEVDDLQRTGTVRWAADAAFVGHIR